MVEAIRVITSSDSFLIERESEVLISSFLSKSERKDSLFRYSITEKSSSNLIEMANQSSMFSSKKVFLISDTDKIKKDDLTYWLGYFELPNPDTLIIFLSKKIDKRLKLWQFANKKGWIKELKLPYPNQMPAWIQEEVTKRHKKIEPAAAQALSDLIGNNLQAQMQSLDKIELYIGDRDIIKVHDVEELVGNYLSKSVFDLVEQVGRGDFKESQNLINQMQIKGEPFVRILFLLIRHFRLLILSHEGLRDNWAPAEWAKKLGVHPFFVKDYQQQVRLLSLEKLKFIFGRCLIADKNLKSSRLDSRFVMDDFLMDVCFN